jgi:hypothetical protein
MVDFLQQASWVARVVLRHHLVSPGFSDAPSFNLRREALSHLPVDGKDAAGDGGNCIAGEVEVCARTRLLSCYLLWGLFCKLEGHCCNFMLLLGPFCSIVTLLLY